MSDVACSIRESLDGGDNGDGVAVDLLIRFTRGAAGESVPPKTTKSIFLVILKDDRNLG